MEGSLSGCISRCILCRVGCGSRLCGFSVGVAAGACYIGLDVAAGYEVLVWVWQQVHVI